MRSALCPSLLDRILPPLAGCLLCPWRQMTTGARGSRPVWSRLLADSPAPRKLPEAILVIPDTGHRLLDGLGGRPRGVLRSCPELHRGARCSKKQHKLCVPQGRYQSYVVEDLMPLVDLPPPYPGDHPERGMAGLSMGGTAACLAPQRVRTCSGLR